MRRQDRGAFQQAAQKFNVWILVRRTNPASLPYIGQQGYTPKRIDCKAKTADHNVERRVTAGLVTDPFRWPDAFDDDRLKKAQKIWREFAEEMDLESGRGEYRVDDDPDSKHFGCLTFEGQYIHGDYDLYDVIPVEHPRGNLAAVESLHGQLHMRGPRVIPVQKFINHQIGVEMIQHGGEMQYADFSEQPVDVFGPKGEDFTILNEYSIRSWYETNFEGRQPLAPPRD